ncbi:hypothetical protein H6P81_017848 [Aristolochia fimbriata]|uniref:Fibrous sheath CABYR-binding protein-like n=1 Tax=Aristolochia fimbriata TaxID=158543 RepID=A0AAV7DZS5_ARIFI|nr:hypothetical protein H6P81_017848 [Aristolochia fimbriata]
MEKMRIMTVIGPILADGDRKARSQLVHLRAPLTTLKDASGSASKKKKKARVEAQPTSVPSPPTFLPPISEVETHVEPQPSCPRPELNPPETVHISSSPEASDAPREEVSHPTSTVQTCSCVVATPEGTEVVEDHAVVAPSSTQLETLPVQEVVPPVVQKDVAPVIQEVAEEGAAIKVEALASVLQEEAPAPAAKEVVGVEAPVSVVREEAPAIEAPVPAIEEMVEIIQEEVPTVAVEEVVEVVQEEVPAVEEASIVQDTVTSLTLPAPPASTSLATPSQQLLSCFKDMMLQIWKDQITPRMLSPDVVRDLSLAAYAEFVISRLQDVSKDASRLQNYTQTLQALKGIESLVGEKASRISKDSTESDTKETLDALSSKLDDAEVTLDEPAEEILQAKLDEEDARECLELAREQVRSAKTRVGYLTTQVDQIQESVQELKEAVLGATKKVEEVAAMPTLSVSEEATLLSLRAAFAELQQEMTKDL